MSASACARVFDQGLDKVVGHVLPVKRDARRGPRWQSGQWFLRGERCYLVPGRFADGLPLAARLAALGGGGRTIPYIHRADPTQPFRAARRAEIAPQLSPTGARPSGAGNRRHRGRAPNDVGA